MLLSLLNQNLAKLSEPAVFLKGRALSSEWSHLNHLQGKNQIG